MKNLLLVLLILFSGLACLAAQEPWKLSADINLTVNQSAYSNNWNGTELGGIAWTASSNLSAEKQLSKLLQSKSTLKLAFGQTHQQKNLADGSKIWEKPIKSTDKIDLESVLKLTADIFIDPFVSGRWESQFLDQVPGEETLYLNPSLFTETAGLSKMIIDADHQKLSTRLGAAFRQKLERSVLNTDTKEYEDIVTNDGGAEFIAEYLKTIPARDIKITSRIELYQAMFNSKEDELANDYWKALDLKWNSTLSSKIWSALSLNLTFDWIYEKEQDLAGQFKQTLGLGVSYRLY